MSEGITTRLKPAKNFLELQLPQVIATLAQERKGAYFNSYCPWRQRSVRDNYIVVLILDIKRPFRQPPALRIVAPALAVVAHVLSEATKEVGHSRFPVEAC